MSTEPTNEGKRLIDDWLFAQKRLNAERSAVVSAECELHNTTTALGKWMMPADAKEGEKFCIWYGNSLIEVGYSGALMNNFVIGIRQRGTSLTRPSR